MNSSDPSPQSFSATASQLETRGAGPMAQRTGNDVNTHRWINEVMNIKKHTKTKTNGNDGDVM